MDEILIERFEPYFKHRDSHHEVLKIGDKAVACKNVRTALAWLGVARISSDDPLSFDDELAAAVQTFQKGEKHRRDDGRVGPGTRSLLVSILLKRKGASWFAKLDGSDFPRIPKVFLAYAWSDESRVNKLDQWLQDHGVHVIRDIDSFTAGSKLKDSIRQSVLSADKVVAVYSQHSKDRDWPSFERQMAEEVERQIQAPVLIYLRLDDTPLKAHDPDRIAIEARGKKLKEIGSEIMKALGVRAERVRYDYDEEESL